MEDLHGLAGFERRLTFRVRHTPSGFEIKTKSNGLIISFLRTNGNISAAHLAIEKPLLLIYRHSRAERQTSSVLPHGTCAPVLHWQRKFFRSNVFIGGRHIHNMPSGKYFRESFDWPSMRFSRQRLPMKKSHQTKLNSAPRPAVRHLDFQQARSIYLYLHLSS